MSNRPYAYSTCAHCEEIVQQAEDGSPWVRSGLWGDGSECEKALRGKVLDVSGMSEECQCSKGAPAAGCRPCLHCGGDNSWCPKHYPAPQLHLEVSE